MIKATVSSEKVIFRCPVGVIDNDTRLLSQTTIAWLVIGDGYFNMGGGWGRLNNRMVRAAHENVPMLELIDGPNLIAGFVIGLVPTAILWILDRRRSHRQRVLDASTEWMRAAKEIELAAGQPTASAASLCLVRVKHPVDLWRSILDLTTFEPRSG